MGSNDQNRISYFPDSIVNSTPPLERFTFPFYYEPHPLTKLAAAELQHYLETQTSIDHNFGLSSVTGEMPIGKMFGVLVVTDTKGKIGYLSAFSGKLAGTNNHPKFVPPVFDMLTENSFFLKEQEVIDAINRQIEELLSDDNYNRQKRHWEELTTQSALEIAAFKQELKTNKEIRRQRREENKNNPNADNAALVEAELAKESHYDRHRLRVLKAEWKTV